MRDTFFLYSSTFSTYKRSKNWKQLLLTSDMTWVNCMALISHSLLCNRYGNLVQILVSWKIRVLLVYFCMCYVECEFLADFRMMDLQQCHYTYPIESEPEQRKFHSHIRPYHWQPSFYCIFEHVMHCSAFSVHISFSYSFPLPIRNGNRIFRVYWNIRISFKWYSYLLNW